MDSSTSRKLSLRKDPVSNETSLPLFRKACTESEQHGLPGQAIIATPPTARVAVAIALLSVALLCGSAWLIEIPQRTSGTGLLMPIRGLLRISAAGPGRVTELYVAEGDAVVLQQASLQISSDTSSPKNESVAELRLASLNAELRELESAHRTRVKISKNRRQTLEMQLRSASVTLDLLLEESDIQLARLTLVEERSHRLRRLADQGSVPLDQYQQHQLEALRAKATISTIQQRIARQDLALQELQSRAHEIDDEDTLLIAQFEIERERLKRAILAAEAGSGRTISSPHAAVVARMAVQRGSTVKTGQTLLTLYQPDETLQAWLYVPSARASKLEAGQSVQIRLDAFPYREFGMLDATVISVSRTSLRPAELDIPLGVQGPVFEIRTALDGPSLFRFGQAQRLRPGLTLRGDLLHRRFRLYEWIFHTLFIAEPTDADAAAA